MTAQLLLFSFCPVCTLLSKRVVNILAEGRRCSGLTERCSWVSCRLCDDVNEDSRNAGTCRSPDSSAASPPSRSVSVCHGRSFWTERRCCSSYLCPSSCETHQHTTTFRFHTADMWSQCVNDINTSSWHSFTAWSKLNTRWWCMNDIMKMILRNTQLCVKATWIHVWNK